MYEDVMDAIARVRWTFESAGLKPPTTLLLESPEEGMRFLSAVRQQCAWSAQIGDSALGKPVKMADGTLWMECKVMDVCVRWPVSRYAMPDGSFRFS